jgi:hypothetical protein
MVKFYAINIFSKGINPMADLASPTPVETASQPVTPVVVDSNTTAENQSGQQPANDVAQQQQTTDNGSDPYVSNGQSTIPQPEPQQETLEDMMPKTEDTPGPTEQDVIKANEDDQFEKDWAAAQEGKITPTEQQQAEGDAGAKAKQAEEEKTQADNRAKLRAEENPQKPTGNVVQLNPAGDWRVRMKIAPTLMALYHLSTPGDVMYPLKQTDGVIFPYTPTIQTGYKANYEPSELVHTNYKNYFYKNSSVEELTITADFTAQDQQEAQYMLAVMHFFRSVTKMFYGQDKSPTAGTPPPLVFLSGMGAYQYDNHPMLISSFSYTLPNDVDYIRTTSNGNYSNGGGPASKTSALDGLAKTASKFGLSSISNMFSSVSRLASAGLNKGGVNASVATIGGITKRADTTFVPTKIQFSISAYPIVTRRDISQNFSLEQYAKGTIYRGTQRGGSGIW